jgi:hypothetical protein
MKKGAASRASLAFKGKANDASQGRKTGVGLTRVRPCGRGGGGGGRAGTDQWVAGSDLAATGAGGARREQGNHV